jgi:hypothetical protein
MKDDEDKKSHLEPVPESEPGKKRKKEEEYFIQEEQKKLERLKEKIKKVPGGEEKK